MRIDTSIGMMARFARDQRGISSVEFALILPLLLALYLGTVDVSQAIAVDRKVTLTSRTLADLASQVTSITNADMTNILNAASSVVSPFDITKLKVVVSEIKIDNSGVAKIYWSDTLNGTTHGVGATVTVIVVPEIDAVNADIAPHCSAPSSRVAVT